MFILILFIILLALDIYTFQGIKTVFIGNIYGLNSIWIYTFYWVISIALPLLFLYGMTEGRKFTPISPFWVLIGNVWFILLISKLVFILIMFGEDIYRIGEALYYKFVNMNSRPMADPNAFLSSRRKFVSNGALVLASIPFLSLTFGIFKGRYLYKIHKQQLFFKDLPEAFEGFTITQISDIHSGSFDDRDGVIKGIEMIKSLNSDLVVFTGDLVNTYASEFDPWIQDFKTIKANYGQYSILGNHDYGEYAQWNDEKSKEENFNKIKQHHSNMDFKLLLDESIRIEKDNQSIQLIGVENWGVGFGKRGNLNKALSSVDDNDFKILLSHDPTHWESEVKNNDKKIHLTLSGHTHGMQMGIEIPGFKWSPVQYRYPKWAGLYNENERFLYVNRGFGVLGFRGRLGIWPEITQIELRKAA